MPASLLEKRDLTKHFDGVSAVEGVSLEILEGEVHAVIGPNGAGKTTFFNLLTGLVPPTRGRIVFRSRDITGLPANRVSHLGMARSFQITSIFPHLSVLENVRVAVQSRDVTRTYNFVTSVSAMTAHVERAREILRLVDLEAREAWLAANLSYGEKRSLEIGIALATDPALLLLDEPTAGMASDEIPRSIDLVGKVAQRLTVVLIEHNLDAVFTLAQRITVLHQGRVLAQGTPAEIRENPAVQDAYLGGY